MMRNHHQRGRSAPVLWPSLITSVGASAVVAALSLCAHPERHKLSLKSAVLLTTSVAAPWIYQFIFRPYHLRWGATAEEASRPLPGDGLVESPWLEATRAITICAPADKIWPWLVQMGGYTRAGWYSYDFIDNARVPSARQIVTELQDLNVGDIMPTSPDGTGFKVATIEPNHLLLLTIDEPYVAASSAIVLDATEEAKTRLLMRLRWRPQRSIRGFLFNMLFEPGDFIMMRKQMLGIKSRAGGGS